MAPINARLTIESGVGRARDPGDPAPPRSSESRRICNPRGGGFRLTRFRPTIVAASEDRLGRREAFSGVSTRRIHRASMRQEARDA